MTACLYHHFSPDHEGEHYVYRLYDSADGLLYVGCTGYLRERMRAHRRQKPWWNKVARIEAMRFACGCHALAHEEVELQDRQPTHTRSHRSVTAARVARMRQIASAS